MTPDSDSPLRILYVDDDPASVRLLRAQLSLEEAARCSLTHVRRLESALERLETLSFDAVLADLGLPDSDGLKTCKRLAEAGGHVPLVVLTASDDLDDAISTVRLGAQDYAVKGDFDARMLIRRVRFAVERRRQELRALQVASLVHGPGGRPAAPVDELGQRPDRPDGSIHLLQVEDDPELAKLVSEQLARQAFVVAHCGRLGDAVDRLAELAYDAILLDLTLPDSDESDTLPHLRPHAGGTPIIVLSWRDDEQQALRCIESGASDYLLKSKLDYRVLQRSVRLAMARRARPFTAARAKRLGEMPRPVEWRKSPRYLLTKSVQALPILPNGAPDANHRMEGHTIDVSQHGIGLTFDEKRPLPFKRLAVGVETDKGQCHFAVVEVRNQERLASGLLIGTRFADAEHDIFTDDNLLPHLNPQTLRFETQLAGEVAIRWTQLGILRAQVVDNVYMCPHCRSLPAFSSGCRSCGSVHVAGSKLIHHFACAHVAYLSEFEREGRLRCPKCRVRDLVVGADFEYLSGPYQCLDCNWSDSGLEQVAKCLHCRAKFWARECREEELYGYHVQRLDPLDLVDPR